MVLKIILIKNKYEILKPYWKTESTLKFSVNHPADFGEFRAPTQ